MERAWDDFRVFLALARGGTIAAAARTLEVSRSTVLRRLANLEERAGNPLFERNADGYSQTAAGEALLPIAEQLETEALRAERLLAGRDLRLEGRIRVSTFGVGWLLISPSIRRFTTLHPEVEMLVSSSNHPVRLERREADVVIRATSKPPESLFGRKLGRLENGVFGTEERVAEANPPWVLWERSFNAHLTWALAHEIGSPLRVAAEVDSGTAMLGLLLAGVGVGLMPTPLMKGYPSLTPLGPKVRPGLGSDVWLLTHPDLQHAARIRALMAVLGEDVPGLLEP
ncbi:MAG: LysR family transcriptional regulator [Myxococcota bacterium]